MLNFFEKAWDFDKSIFKGVGNVYKATMNGFTGDGFDYGDAGRNFHQAGQDFVNGFTGQSGDPPSLADNQQAANNIANDPNTAWNSQNWKSYGSATNATSFGAQTPNAGLALPSQLMKISDPATKLGYASVAGNPAAQTMVNNSGSQMNASIAPVIAAAAN